jgi:hypothetical protein
VSRQLNWKYLKVLKRASCNGGSKPARTLFLAAERHGGTTGAIRCIVCQRLSLQCTNSGSGRHNERGIGSDAHPLDAIVGAPLSRFLLGFLDGWPVTSDQSSATISDSDVETLLISGALDGSTPMRYARDELMPHLNNGHHVVLKAQGHTKTFWNTQAQARAHMPNTYFNTGVVDDSLYQHESLIFDVNQSWGGMANALLTAFISIFGIPILLAVLATSRIRKFYQVKTSSGNEPDYRALNYRDA